jgi:hypothetical protein
MEIKLVYTEQEILDGKWERLRVVRNRALAATDWCMMADSPLNAEQKAVMASYRNALRNLPESSSNPDDIVLPEYPIF